MEETDKSRGLERAAAETWTIS